MNPLIAHLILALMSGTGQWQESQFFHFYEQVDHIIYKEVVDLKDIEDIVEAFNKEQPWIMKD